MSITGGHLIHNIRNKITPFIWTGFHRFSRQIASFRKSNSALDRWMGKGLEYLYILLSSRSPEVLSEWECREAVERLKDYQRIHHKMAEERHPGGFSGPLILHEVGVGQFTSRVLDVEDLNSEAFRCYFSKLVYSPENQHRKDWEKSFVSMLVDHFNAGHEKAVCLGLGVGTEVLLFYFANLCQRVIGIDLYNSETWEGAAIPAEQVHKHSPFPYRRQHLEVRHMDMRDLDFEPESFDFVWSISAVEHVSSITDLEKVFGGVEKVLKPGGYAFITTEWNLVPSNPRYKPGCFIFDEALLNHLLCTTPELDLIGPVRTKQSSSPLHIYLENWKSNINTEVRPTYNIYTSGTFSTAVVLVFQKLTTDDTPPVN